MWAGLKGGSNKEPSVLNEKAFTLGGFTVGTLAVHALFDEAMEDLPLRSPANFQVAPGGRPHVFPLRNQTGTVIIRKHRIGDVQ